MDTERVYDPKLTPIYPEATNQFLSDLPPEPTHGRAKDLAEAPPAEREAYLADLIRSQQVDLRTIETSAKAIAIRSSLMKEIIELSPDAAALLSEELRIQIEEWVSVVVEYIPSLELTDGLIDE